MGDDQVMYIVQHQGIAALASLLDPNKNIADVRIITVALEGLENILKVAKRKADVFHRVLEMFDQAQAIDFLELLESHQNGNLATKAKRILEKYWTTEDV